MELVAMEKEKISGAGVSLRGDVRSHFGASMLRGT